MDDAYVVIAIVLCVFAFLAVLLGIGQFYGGEWNTVAQGVAEFIMLIMGFCFAAIVIVRLMGRK